MLEITIHAEIWIFIFILYTFKIHYIEEELNWMLEITNSHRNMNIIFILYILKIHCIGGIELNVRNYLSTHTEIWILF